MSIAEVPTARITNVFVRPPVQAVGQVNNNFDLIITATGGPFRVAPGMSLDLPISAAVTAIAYDTGPGNSGGTTRTHTDIG
jgi:hypothetical protein